MPCGCGKKLNRRFSSKEWEDIPFDERNMVMLSTDNAGCAPYTGAFQGESVHIAGFGTEFEKVFPRRYFKAALEYGRTYGVKVGRLVSTRSLCHDTVVEALGA